MHQLSFWEDTCRVDSVPASSLLLLAHVNSPCNPPTLPALVKETSRSTWLNMEFVPHSLSLSAAWQSNCRAANPPPPPAYLLSNEIKLAFGMPLSTAFPLQWKQDKNSKNSRYMLENKATKWGMLDFWLLGLWRGIRVRNSGVLPGLRWKEILHWVNATCCWKQAHHLGKAWQVSNTENCK